MILGGLVVAVVAAGVDSHSLEIGIVEDWGSSRMMDLGSLHEAPGRDF